LFFRGTTFVSQGPISRHATLQADNGCDPAETNASSLMKIRVIPATPGRPVTASSCRTSQRNGSALWRHRCHSSPSTFHMKKLITIIIHATKYRSQPARGQSDSKKQWSCIKPLIVGIYCRKSRVLAMH